MILIEDKSFYLLSNRDSKLLALNVNLNHRNPILSLSLRQATLIF